ncbi:MAG: hypothetical protein ACTHLH_10675, partial [Solirubrobacterales bacterium]
MEPLRDDRLIADLQALRPTPRPQFAAELDERAAAGFPRRSRLPRVSFERLRVSPRRLLLPASGAAVAAVAVATVLVIANQGESTPGPLGSTASRNPAPASSGTLGDLQYFNGFGPSAKPAPTGGAEEAGSTASEAEAQVVPSEVPTPDEGSFRLHHRAVERSAEIVL